MTEHEELRKKYKILEEKCRNSVKEKNELNNRLRMTLQDFDSLQFGKYIGFSQQKNGSTSVLKIGKIRLLKKVFFEHFLLAN